MSCKGFLECLLKLVNFFLTLAGLAIVGYGIYLLVRYNQASHEAAPPPSGYHSSFQLGRPLFVALSLSTNLLHHLPKAWFIYAFIGIGVILFVISCFGCVGVVARNGCCLSSYSVLVILLIALELAFAGFIFFDKSWKKEIPKDQTGEFYRIYDFLEENWKILKWVALGAVILEALLFLLAVLVKAANQPADYDSDDEIINPRQIRQPLLSRPPPNPGLPSAPVLDQRQNRNDAWSTRMREKYGLDTGEFTYVPNEGNRYQQATAAQAGEDRRWCVIM